MQFTHPKKDSYLQNHVIKSTVVDGNDQCELSCYLEKFCYSYNIGAQTSGAKFMCELSDSDHYQHPGDLGSKKGFSYHPAMVSMLPGALAQRATNATSKALR